MILRIIGAIVIAIIAVLLVDYFGHEPQKVVTSQPSADSSLRENLAGAAPTATANQEEQCVIHVSYNSLTGGRSKAVWKKNDHLIYVVMGTTRDYGLLQCVVSKEFFDAMEENSHVKIPCSLCEGIRP